MDIKESPYVIFIKGNLPSNEELEKSFAIVGTRKPSKEGIAFARDIGQYLSRNNIYNISGLALGIDTEGHNMSLQKTGAILGQGLDLEIYPRENIKLVEMILENNGFLLSELIPQTEISLFSLIKRDRLQSALTSGIIIAETGIKGGTVNTFKYAREQKRKIFVSDINREFKLSGSYERGLAGDRYEMKLKNELKQSEIAKECAEWIRKKVEVRAYDEEYSLPQKMYIMEQNESENSYIVGSADFTSSGLGIVPSNKIEMNTYEKNTNSTQMWLMQFNMLWNNNEKVKDVKKALLNSLEVVYKENTSEFIYFVTLYNIFKDYLNELTEEEIVKSKTGFKDSVVWNKLYNFQKDGVLGAIDKLEKYNGCILADSVGLGKTFEALAIIKYYELRNNRVLVLCPKKLRENWLTYRANRRDNILEKDRLNYDVLNHTDLSRYTGYSGDINLEEIYWENYDLIVIDESHNFRNNNNSRDNKETRYSRLLNQIIKKGIKTKVLMLSATPVNNRMNDLKNQIAFATEGNDRALSEHGIKSIEQTLRKAQMSFNKWNDLQEENKNIENLLEMLEVDYFKLLDMLTIARSRKHIQKYYDTTSIGKFPKRLNPINVKVDVDTKNDFIKLAELNKLIRSLSLAIYSPIFAK